MWPDPRCVAFALVLSYCSLHFTRSRVHSINERLYGPPPHTFQPRKRAAEWSNCNLTRDELLPSHFASK